VLTAPPSLDQFRGWFSESEDPAQWPHVATGLTYRRGIRLLAEHLGLEPTEQAVHQHRLASDLEAYAASLLGPTNIGWLLLDDGFPPPQESFSPEQMGAASGAQVRPVMRLERVAEEALDLPLDQLREHVRQAVRGARAAGFVGLKSIAAYRTGLDVGPPDEVAAERGRRESGPRLRSKPLLDLLLHDALEVNRADPLPLQLHAGFGDADLRLERANPALLQDVIERYPETPFVFLHCYPYVREAGWLAHVYGHVYLDVSLSIPHVRRSAEMLREALELAPASKLLYASDAARTPELYLLAATWWREALHEVLWEALPADEAEELAALILAGNARKLYRLD
jgi:uncharacterized protein